MDQASRIIANWIGASDIVSRERLACGAWKKAVGKKIADKTRAVKLVRDRLVVEVEDDLWRSNLWGLRFQILKRLESAVGAQLIADLEFRVMPPRRDVQRETAPALMEDESLKIPDPGLRRIYRNSRRRETA